MKQKIKDKLYYLGVIFATLFILVSVCFIYFFQVLKVDLMENVEITYTGESGSGTVEIVNNSFLVSDRMSSFINGITYEATPNSDLKNGDVITIVATYDHAYATEKHIHPSNETMEVVVSDLPNRYDTIDQIGKETLTAMSTQGIAAAKNADITQLVNASGVEGIQDVSIKDVSLSETVFLKSNTMKKDDKVLMLYTVNIQGKNEAGEDVEASCSFLVMYQDVHDQYVVNSGSMSSEILRMFNVSGAFDRPTFTLYLNSKYILDYQIQFQ